MKEHMQKAKILCLLCLVVALIVNIARTNKYSDLANAQQNKTLMQPQGVQVRRRQRMSQRRILF